MGTFRVPIEIGDPEGRRYERLKRLKDPGATHALLAREILDRLGVRSQRERRFILADQREAIYQTAWVMAKIDGEAQRIIVVSGEPGRDAQLGAVTLEEFGLVVGRVRRRLVPVPGLLK